MSRSRPIPTKGLALRLSLRPNLTRRRTEDAVMSMPQRWQANEVVEDFARTEG